MQVCVPASQVELQQSALLAHGPPSLTQQVEPTEEPPHCRPGQQGKTKTPHGNGPVQSTVTQIPPFGEG